MTIEKGSAPHEDHPNEEVVSREYVNSLLKELGYPVQPKPAVEAGTLQVAHLPLPEAPVRHADEEPEFEQTISDPKRLAEIRAEAQRLAGDK